MDNNDILKRLRYTFDFSDNQMIETFGLGNLSTNRPEVSSWLKNELDVDFAMLSDFQLASFLNGLITLKRGKKEGALPIPEKKLQNNIILRKLKIALSLQDTDMLQIMDLAQLKISKHELSAFFRKPSQSQYRECKDQILRKFLRGLQIKYRETKVR
jgi:uncharacterized protein YehS (DUF1456 family)